MPKILFLFCSFFLLSMVHADNFVGQPDVKLFINHMVKQYKFKESELTTLFSTVKMRPKVIQSVKTPLEQKTLEYLQNVIHYATTNNTRRHLLAAESRHVSESGKNIWCAREHYRGDNRDRIQIWPKYRRVSCY